VQGQRGKKTGINFLPHEINRIDPKTTDTYFSLAILYFLSFFPPLSSSASSAQEQIREFCRSHDEAPETKATRHRRYPQTFPLLVCRCVRPDDPQDVASGGGVKDGWEGVKGNKTEPTV
jgi:hypothetical protein